MASVMVVAKSTLLVKFLYYLLEINFLPNPLKLGDEMKI